jgi:hypothetical protein
MEVTRPQKQMPSTDYSPVITPPTRRLISIVRCCANSRTSSLHLKHAQGAAQLDNVATADMGSFGNTIRRNPTSVASSQNEKRESSTAPERQVYYSRQRRPNRSPQARLRFYSGAAADAVRQAGGLLTSPAQSNKGASITHADACQTPSIANHCETETWFRKSTTAGHREAHECCRLEALRMRSIVPSGAATTKWTEEQNIVARATGRRAQRSRQECSARASGLRGFGEGRSTLPRRETSKAYNGLCSV